LLPLCPGKKAEQADLGVKLKPGPPGSVVASLAPCFDTSFQLKIASSFSLIQGTLDKGSLSSSFTAITGIC
jgi:hypothetical protein